MITNFEKCFDKIILLEGAQTNDEHDTGGITKFGISKKAYPNEDIENLTLTKAKLLYKRDYWDKIKGDELPAPLDMFMFDAAVNQGVEAAVKMLQKTFGIPQDGIFGVKTLQKAKSISKDQIALYMSDRVLRYIGTRSFDRYGRGWVKRLFLITMRGQHD